MKFNQFDLKMRKYEESFDICVPPDTWYVVRLDGRNFHNWTAIHEKPFSDYFIACMSGLCEDIMHDSGFNIIYAYHQSDEISLLIHRDCNQLLKGFNPKTQEVTLYERKKLIIDDNLPYGSKYDELLNKIILASSQ